MKILIMIKLLIVKLLEITGGGLLISMTVIVFIGVLDRYWLHISLAWPEEIARYHLIWLSLLSASLAVTTKGHYVLEYIYKKILTKLKHRIIMEIINNLVVCIISFLLMINGIKLLQVVAWQGAPATNISMLWVYLPVPLCLFLIVFFYIIKTLESIFYLKNDDYLNCTI